MAASKVAESTSSLGESSPRVKLFPMRKFECRLRVMDRQELRSSQGFFRERTGSDVESATLGNLGTSCQILGDKGCDRLARKISFGVSGRDSGSLSDGV
jgi:hypothetical protein